MTKKNTPYRGDAAYLFLFYRSVPDPKFLGLPDPNPLVRGTNPDPSIIKQN
jgi:hypothetical protein